jgi:TonB family protein
MNKGCLFLLLVLLSSTFCAARDDRGYCPSSSGISKEARAGLNPTPNQTPPEAGATFAGTVFVLLIINEKGYVCSAQVIQGFDKQANKRAVETTRQWRFNPSKKNGNPVAVEMRVEISFWRNAKGELIFASPTKPKNESQMTAN